MQHWMETINFWTRGHASNRLILSSMVVMICIAVYVFAFLLLVPFLMTGFLFFFCDIIDIYDVSLGDILVYFLKMILPQTSSMSTVTMEEECMLLVT